MFICKRPLSFNELYKYKFFKQTHLTRISNYRYDKVSMNRESRRNFLIGLNFESKKESGLENFSEQGLDEHSYPAPSGSPHLF